METLSNSILTVQIAEHGAELQSIKKDGKEYLWQGDAKFWGRRSPVLFPIVGRVWNNKYRHAGNTYEIGQHGFARDMDFKLTYKEDKGAVYWLESTPDTLGKFPFPFRLLVGYLLEENKITVKWRVENLGAWICISRLEHTQLSISPSSMLLQRIVASLFLTESLT